MSNYCAALCVRLVGQAMCFCSYCTVLYMKKAASHADEAVGRRPFVRPSIRMYASVSYFRQELYAYQPDFLLCVVVFTELAERFRNVDGLRVFFEVVENFVDVLLVHYFVEEIVDVYFRSRIDYRLYLVQQFVEVYSVEVGQVVKRDFAVDGLND